MATDDLSRLAPLDELDDFQVAEGDPDVRGWEVVTADGRKIGEVDELLIDTAARKVRYLDVDVDESLLAEGAGEDRHVLLPIGYARLDEDDDRVIVNEISSDQVAGLPEYTHAPVTRDYEVTVLRSFDPGYTATDRDLYEHDLYDESRFYGARRRTL